MELRDLRFFCLTAEMEHVTRAADRLSVSQPFLTKVIGQIEEELGARLFEKAGRNIRLNSYGRVFYTQAKKVLAEMDNLYTEMDYALESHSRSISLLCNTEAYVLGILDEFNKINADYALNISFTARENMAFALTSGEADFLLCSPPLEEGAGIVTEIVLRDAGCVLLPPEHPLLKKESVDFSDLAGMSLVTNVRGSAMRNKQELEFEKHGFRPQIVFESYSIDQIIHAVDIGMGYAFLTKHVVLTRPELKDRCVDVSVPNACEDFGLSRMKHTEGNRYAEHFWAFVLEHMRRLNESLPKG